MGTRAAAGDSHRLAGVLRNGMGEMGAVEWGEWGHGFATAACWRLRATRPVTTDPETCRRAVAVGETWRAEVLPVLDQRGGSGSAPYWPAGGITSLTSFRPAFCFCLAADRLSRLSTQPLFVWTILFSSPSIPRLSHTHGLELRKITQ